MAFGIDDAIANVSTLLTTAVNKIWPDPADKAKAEAVTVMAAADAAVTQLKAAQAVMLAEATSSDKWTSRARPSLLYVMYFMILCSVPFGFLAAIQPAVASNVAGGMNAWLAAIPDTLWQMMGFCYLGYTGGRTFEKIKRVAK